jgi:hypothetical protein
MVLLPWRVYLLVIFAEIAVTLIVIAAFGNPRTSVAAALALSISIGSIPAVGAEHALRRRKPPLRFGLPATAIIVVVIWVAFATVLYVQTYQAY